MLPCAFPAWKCFPACSCFPIALRIGTSAGSCFPMLPKRLPLEHLPRSSFRTAATRGAATLPHRLPLRSILPQRFACGSFQSRGHGRPRSVRKSSRLRWKCLSMDCICPQDCCCSDIANLSAHLHRLLTPPPYLLLMRLSPGRGRRCCVQDEAAAWPGGRCCVQDEAVAWPGAAFLQITARTNPCSRHLWGTLARAVASICAHRAR